VSFSQIKMRAELGEPIKNIGPWKQNSCLPEDQVVDLNKTIHEYHEFMDKVKKELGLLESDIHKHKVEIACKISDCST
jgi:hypothetical protein